MRLALALALAVLAPAAAVPTAQAEPLLCAAERQVCAYWWSDFFQLCFGVDVILYAVAVSHSETACVFDPSPCQPNCDFKLGDAVVRLP